MRAIAKGWAWTHDHPEEAVKLTVEAYPQLDLAIELQTVPRSPAQLRCRYRQERMGQLRPRGVQEQIAIYDKVGQFKSGAPKLEDCITTKILEMTAGERPKFS
jgi:NitT/TauT family transport system substrate-binding protein